MFRNILIACGIAASLVYILLNIAILPAWPAYSAFSQTVSELSAIDAPTRSTWLIWGIVYACLMTLFGFGVWYNASKRSLRIAGIFIWIYGMMSAFWPPMHQREVLAAGGETMTDTMHLVFAGITVLLMVLQIIFGMMSFGKSFRIYSIITLLVLMLFGLLTSLQAPDVNANLPTPWIGVWERINIGVYLLWIIVLSVIQLRLQKDAGPAH